MRYCCRVMRQIIERVRTKNLEAILVVVYLSKAFDSIHREKVEKILIVYNLPPKTVSAKMILYKKHKTNDSLTRLCHRLHYCQWPLARRYIRAILVHNLPTLCISEVNRFNKIKWLNTKKKFKKQTISRRNYEKRRLRRWSNASLKYTSPSRMPTA